MSKINFLSKYAVTDRHYNSHDEIDKALNDSDWVTRHDAAGHPNATKEHLDKALDDVHWAVRAIVFETESPNVTKEHIDKALDDPQVIVRHAAIHHPNVTKEHIDKALNDSHVGVIETARKRLKEFDK